MNEISIAELDDEPEKVYVIGLGEQPESVREWFYRPKGEEGGFGDWWDDKFDHAESLVLPASVSVGEVLTLEKEEIEEVIEDE